MTPETWFRCDPVTKELVPACDCGDCVPMVDRPKRIGMTRRQRECLRWIQAFTLSHGHPPLLREIADGLGIRHASGVVRLIDLLVERGRLVRDKNKARSIRVVSPEDL